MLARLGVIALVFGLTVSSGQAQEEREDSQGQAQADQQPTQGFPIPLPVDIVEGEAEAETRDRREQEARQREIEDLAAQKGMNAATQSIEVATRDMRDYALYSTLLVALGTALLFYTLRLTRQANESAQAAVDVTREMGKKQTRAYVYAKLEGITEDIIVDIDAGEDIEVNFGIVNSGNSPAHRLRFISTIAIVPHPITIDEGNFGPKAGQTTPDATLVPNEPMYASAGNHAPFIRDDLRQSFDPNGTKRVYVIGRIFYGDIFGDDQESWFCYFIDPQERIIEGDIQSGVGRLVQSPKYNRST